MTDSDDSGAAQAPQSPLRRYGPIAAIGLGAAAALFFARDYLSFDALAENREALVAWRDSNIVIAALTYLVVYVLAVAFSVPGAIWLTIGGGFLFGTLLGGSLTVIAATIGATLIFLAAKTALGSSLREKAGPWLKKLEAGFQENEANYMLVLRLVPAVPFFIANLAPAFLGVKLRTYIWTTLLGIIPGTFVYSSVGASLGTLLDRGEKPDLGVIFELHIIGPLLGLAALSLLPVIIKKIRGGGPVEQPSEEPKA